MAEGLPVVAASGGDIHVQPNLLKFRASVRRKARGALRHHQAQRPAPASAALHKLNRRQLSSTVATWAAQPPFPPTHHTAEHDNPGAPIERQKRDGHQLGHVHDTVVCQQGRGPGRAEQLNVIEHVFGGL